MGIPDERNASERLPGLYAYFTGFFLLMPVADLIVMSGWFDPYVLFIEPLVRSSLIIITAVVLRTAFGFYGSAKYILIVAAALVPGAVTALVPSFFMQNSYLAAIGVAFTVVLGAALSLFLITRAKR